MLYFGYGSLVNRHTRAASEIFHKASLPGWERQWAHWAERPWHLEEPVAGILAGDKPGVCALTVAEAPGKEIDGVLAQIDDADVAALDQREAGYRRITLPASAFSTQAPVGEAQISMYVSATANNNWASLDYPILMSYVECVLAGFRQQFGEQGTRRFMETTAGWNRPLFGDRKIPLYPRAVSLAVAEQELVDSLLAEYTH